MAVSALIPFARLRVVRWWNRTTIRSGGFVWGRDIDPWTGFIGDDFSPSTPVDELAYLLPALAPTVDDAGRSVVHPDVRAVLQHVYLARLWLAVSTIKSTPEEQLDLLSEKLHLSLAIKRKVLRIGPAAVSCLGLNASVVAGRPWVSDLAALRRLGKFLEHAHANVPNIDFVTATSHAIESGINPAYVYTKFGSAHEHFLVAAWTGHITRGRPCELHITIANYLSETFARPRSSCPANKLIRKMLTTTFDEEALIQKIDEVAAHRRVIVVDPVRILRC